VTGSHADNIDFQVFDFQYLKAANPFLQIQKFGYMNHLKKVRFCLFLILIVVANALFAQHDLALFANMNKRVGKFNEEVTFTIVVYNEGRTDINNLRVNALLPPQSKWVRDDSKGAYDPVSGIWTIGTMSSKTDSLKIRIVFTAHTEGVNMCIAEIAGLDGKDKDSTPSNGHTQEDDIATCCISLPMKICANEFEITVNALDGFANYQWYRNDTALIGYTRRSYLITKPGVYHCRAFLQDGSELPVFSCPLVVDSLTAPSVITADRTIEVGEAVCIQTFARDLNELTYKEGKLSFHLSKEDAQSNRNPLTNLVVAPTATTTYFARKSTARCADVKGLQIVVR
jgi:uncharacterized repeat protein (TIGR01451 family)